MHFRLSSVFHQFKLLQLQLSALSLACAYIPVSLPRYVSSLRKRTKSLSPSYTQGLPLLTSALLIQGPGNIIS